MDNPIAGELLDRLRQRYELRHIEKSNRYLGIYKGLCIDAQADGDTIHFFFFSPTANLLDEVIRDFAGFETFDRSSFSKSWLEGPSGHGTPRGGCVLTLNQNRLNTITEDDFLRLPEILLEDFRKFGAEERPGNCPHCEQRTIDTLFLKDHTYQYSCSQCFNEIRQAKPVVDVRSDQPVNWFRANVLLMGFGLAFALVWGGVQQPAIGLSSRIWLIIIPIVCSCFICKQLEKCGPSNVLLRIYTVSILILAFLAGNIWGYRSAVAQEYVLLPWMDVTESYFTRQLVSNIGTEIWYLIGGVIGAWIGFRPPPPDPEPVFE